MRCFRSDRIKADELDTSSTSRLPELRIPKYRQLLLSLLLINRPPAEGIVSISGMAVNFVSSNRQVVQHVEPTLLIGFGPSYITDGNQIVRQAESCRPCFPHLVPAIKMYSANMWLAEINFHT